MAKIILKGDEEARMGIHYEIDTTLPPIGEGGMGKVYKGVCVDEHTGALRAVAIKFMFDGLPERSYKRARRESEIRLRNDNLVEMLGFIELPYIDETTGTQKTHCHVVSELLDGVSLADVLEGQTKNRNGEELLFVLKMRREYMQNPETFATFIVKSVLSGLMALHDAGYIHRDIDPSNIMLTADGHVKLIDFGIAKQMRTLTTSDKALTVAGKFMGKPEYAAPELVLGDVAHQNQTTDIYSVGILYYQCIVGHTPFEGARHDVLDMQLKKKMPLGKIKNRAIRSVIETACQKQQQKRYSTSAQMRVALENLGKKEGILIGVLQRTRLWIAAAVVIAIMALAGSVAVIRHNKEQEAKKAEAALAELRLKETYGKIAAKVAEADKFAKLGADLESDVYEVNLIKACQTYITAESMARNNKGVYDAALIEKKKQDVFNSLDSANVLLLQQAATLEEVGESELADIFRKRAANVESFIAKNKK